MSLCKDSNLTLIVKILKIKGIVDIERKNSGDIVTGLVSRLINQN